MSYIQNILYIYSNIKITKTKVRACIMVPDGAIKKVASKELFIWRQHFY